jgi:hypothetical protein
MTPAEREKAIIEHIQSHPSCNVEDVVRGVDKRVSRVTVFKILHKLIENGAVKNYSENNQKRNARDHKLFVDEGNPLVSVRLELEKFESAYFNLFNKALIEIFEPKQSQAVLETKDVPRKATFVYPYSKLIRDVLDIFYSMVDACLFRFLFIWSQKIPDKHVLQQLHSMIFSKIADMQTRLSEGLKSTELTDINKITESFIHERLTGSKGSTMLVKYLGLFKHVGAEKEIESVIDSLWNIIGDLQLNAYPEPRMYGWPFTYGEDDWRKLVNLLRKHRKSIPHSTDKS